MTAQQNNSVSSRCPWIKQNSTIQINQIYKRHTHFAIGLMQKIKWTVHEIDLLAFIPTH